MFELGSNAIVFNNGRRHSFPNLIAEAVQFEESVVIRLSQEPYHRTNENVYCFDFRGNLQWQIPPRAHHTGESPYVTVKRTGDFVEATNWDGYSMTLNPRTGIVVTEGYHPWSEARSRQPSRRRWI